jgi:hypothetical protein
MKFRQQYFKELKMKKILCRCAVCKSAKSESISESDLHMFVGAHKATHKSSLRSFEDDFQFESVTHWDVGLCGETRYFIYRDMKFNAIAWYDNETNCGYRWSEQSGGNYE